MRPSIMCSCPRDADGSVRDRDPYCNVHGRIRDMDAGASPFVDIAEVADQRMRDAGLTEEQIDQLNRENPAERSELGKRLAREASAADAHGSDPFQREAERLIDMMEATEAQIPEGCLCTYSSSSDYGIRRYDNERCPVHGNPEEES